MDLQWRLGASHQLPNAPSRLPWFAEPGADVDDTFPDDASHESVLAADLKGQSWIVSSCWISTVARRRSTLTSLLQPSCQPLHHIMGGVPSCAVFGAQYCHRIAVGAVTCLADRRRMGERAPRCHESPYRF